MLTACLRALARWADEDNTRRLSFQSHQLESWFLEGIDLNKDIIPVLRSFSSRTQGVPQLRSWKYFEEAVKAQHQSRVQTAQKMSSAPPEEQKTYISTTASTARQGNHYSEREYAVSRILSNVGKANKFSKRGEDLE